MASIQRLAIKADLDSLDQARHFVEQASQQVGMSSDQTGDLVLAIDEAVTNVVMHGGDGSGDRDIELEALATDAQLLVHLRDNGVLFDPTRSVDVDLETSPLERDAPGGFGMFLINTLVDEARYMVTPDGRNQLTLVKNR